MPESAQFRGPSGQTWTIVEREGPWLWLVPEYEQRRSGDMAAAIRLNAEQIRRLGWKRLDGLQVK